MRPIIIGIAGGSGSGKTTVAVRVAGHFPDEKVVTLHHDSYYVNRPELPLEQRHTLNYDHPESFENPLILSHLEKLRSGETIEQPIYDYGTHLRAEETRTICWSNADLPRTKSPEMWDLRVSPATGRCAHVLRGRPLAPG